MLGRVFAHRRWLRRFIGGAALCVVAFALAAVSRAADTQFTAPAFNATEVGQSPAQSKGVGAVLEAAPEAGRGASQPALTEQTEVRLVSAAAAAGDATGVRLGLDFTLQPGWKIYWRSPGAAGFPPHVEWEGSQNLARAEILWPAPERFSVLGLVTLGYHDRVVLPIHAELARPGEPLSLKAKVDYLTCREICIPYTAELALDLPAGPAAPTAFTHLIDRFENEVPRDGRAAGLSIERATIAGSPEKPVLEVEALAREPFQHPDLFIEGPSPLDFAAPVTTLTDAGHSAVLSVAIGTVAKEFPDWRATPLTLTLVDGARSVETRITASAGPAKSEGATFALMLLLALLGGLILNLMPCVLPVLSLKLLGVVTHGGAGRGAVRVSFLASAAGIVFAFLLLAAATIAVKLAGHAVGWGIQFQEPVFLTALAVVCVLFAANLWGLFEIRLPGFLADAMTEKPGKGHRGIAGQFLTGAFTTILATPCSAPFLGTAVGFALARGPFEIAAIFAALGIGLALPYLLVAAVPGLVRYLPAPGRWMATLKAVLGVALAGTALWLVSVMAAIFGLRAAVAVGLCLAGTPLALWARHLWPDFTRRSGVTAVAALVILAFALPGELPADNAGGSERDRAGWAPFARADIPSLVAQGKVVFVDVTADWCINCKANEAFVLDRPPVAQMLAAPSVVRMLADWTRPSDEIAGYLASFGRYGIPFNVVYGPGAPAGIALPELLTPDLVAEALDKAGSIKRTSRN
ncbi:MAG TPA: protein-disulfide reductase DsbD domain-containing protein [Alphaproteobacteria bacterium]